MSPEAWYQKFNSKKAKVLIVEDNQESIDLLVYFLKPSGYEIMVAQDGLEAIETVEKTPPDVILLDIMLPKLDGFQVCERLKKNQQTFHIPVVMITALKELKDKIKALEAGADDFISKPFDSVELLARVKSLLRLKFYHDELIERNKELEIQKKRLLREDHLKKDLTNLIVHDMKNPLFVIQGNLQMMHMQRQGGQDFDEEKYTRRIERSSRGLLRMILNLLDISRLEQNTMELEPVPVDLNAILRDTVEFFQDLPEFGDKIIDFKLSESLPPAYLDKDVFERVLNNLFNYIFNNTPRDLRIVIATERDRSDTLLIRVFHEGKPIPDDLRKKVFEKFAQPELKKRGFKPARALGLIFCKLALKASGGDIWLDPEATNGNCFCIRVPQFRNRH